MSFQDRELRQIVSRVRRLKQRETEAPNRWLEWRYKSERGFWMLYHEFLRDEVAVRAESLAYFMLFSLLPLIAGAFFIFSIFAQFGFVTEALSGFFGSFLETIPEEHRGFVTGYALEFKDAYLQNLSAKSGSLGIFAVLILIWIGLSAFLNIDRTLNLIWDSENRRPFLEQVRNFLFIAFAAPLALIAGLSVPFVLRNISATNALIEFVPGMGALLNWAIPVALILLTFFLLYRFVPVRKVQARAALAGAAFTAVVVQLVNLGMNFYFRVGTQTAYGKAAVIPLVAFWIYITWIVVILGAEISFLVQRGEEILEARDESPSLFEAQGLLRTLRTLRDAFAHGSNPVTFEKLMQETELDSGALRCVLRFLDEQKLLIAARLEGKGTEGSFALARDLSTVPAEPMLRTYFRVSGKDAGKDAWHASLDQWMKHFHGRSLAEL